MDDSPPPPPTTNALQPNCDSLDDFMGRQVKRLMREEDASGLSSRLPLPLLPLPRHEVMTSPETAVRLRGNSSKQQGGFFDFGRFLAAFLGVFFCNFLSWQYWGLLGPYLYVF